MTLLNELVSEVSGDATFFRFRAPLMSQAQCKYSTEAYPEVTPARNTDMRDGSYVIGFSELDRCPRGTVRLRCIANDPCRFAECSSIS